VRLIIVICEDVPQIRTEAQQLAARLDQGIKVIDDARQEIQAVADKVKPVRDRLQQAMGYCDKAAADLDSAKTTIDTRILPGITQIEACIAKAKQQACLDQKLDETAGTLVPGVQAADKAASVASSVLGEVNGLVRDVDDVLSPLDVLRSGVNGMEDVVGKIYHPLQDLQKVLGQKVEVSFKYPDPKKSNPFHMGDYKIGISIKTALKGPSEIEKEIQKILTGEMYKIAKAFGIKKLIESLMKDANSAVNGVLKDLHLDIRPDQIPGVSEVKGLAGKVDAKASNLAAKLSWSAPDLGPVRSFDTYLATQACKNALCL
jgi:uncharacterized protein YoxC